MTPNQRWLYAIAFLIVAAIFGFDRLAGTPSNPPPISVRQEQTLPAPQTPAGSGVVWSHGEGGAQANAEHHWQKHGSEFPEFRSAEAYEAGALAFVRTPPPGTETKHRSNGDTLYYDPATNTFAVADRDGEPRTFFRPDNGRAYWNRQ